MVGFLVGSVLRSLPCRRGTTLASPIKLMVIAADGTSLGRLQNRWRRIATWAKWTILGLALLLVAARLALPTALKWNLNRKLSRIQDYAGRVGSVRVHLWRGAYEIRNLRIEKNEGSVPVPLFASSSIDLSVQWRELLHGSLVGEIVLRQPELNFVAAPTPEKRQTDVEGPWGTALQSLFPFQLNRFEIQRGQVRFRDNFKSRPVDIFVTNLFAVATNLTNNRQVSQRLPAGVTATGQTLGDGRLRIDLKMDPLDSAPTFELNAVLTNVDMVALNDFLRSYGKMDVEAGRFSLFTSVASRRGKYAGNVKVLFENLNVFEWEKERRKNVLAIFWEAIVGVLSAGFKNHPHDRLAAEIPVTGSFTDPHFGIWSAVGSCLKNAFVRVLLPKIDQPVHLDDLKPGSP